MSISHRDPASHCLNRQWGIARSHPPVAADCEITERFHFIYYTQLNHGLSEYEYDHVFVGEFHEEPQPNHEEVSHWQWIAPEALKRALQEQPTQYTSWLKASLERVLLLDKE